MPAGAGYDQVADAAQPGKGLCLAAEQFAETAHFGDAARHQCRLGVVAELHAVDDARRDRHHVFQCAAEFHPDHVGAGVDPEIVVDEALLDQFGQREIGRRGHHRGRNPAGDFLGMAGTGKDHIAGFTEHGFDHFTDPEPGIDFDSLGDVDQHMALPVEYRSELREHTAQILGRRGENQHVAPLDRFAHIRFEAQSGRKLDTREKTGIAAGAAHFVKVVRKRSPDRHVVAVGHLVHRQGGPPAAVAEYGDAHGIISPRIGLFSFQSGFRCRSAAGRCCRCGAGSPAMRSESGNRW